MIRTLYRWKCQISIVWNQKWPVSKMYVNRIVQKNSNCDPKKIRIWVDFFRSGFARSIFQTRSRYFGPDQMKTIFQKDKKFGPWRGFQAKFPTDRTQKKTDRNPGHVPDQIKSRAKNSNQSKLTVRLSLVKVLWYLLGRSESEQVSNENYRTW